MKRSFNSLFLLAALTFTATVFTSCEDEPDKYKISGGNPTIRYIRSVGAEGTDSILTGAYMDNSICIVGDNLRSVYKLVFNDQEAVLNNSYITDHTLLVDVPNKIPGEVSNKIYFYNKNGDMVDYDFSVLVPGPTIASMSNEFALPGTVATLSGDYFIDYPTVQRTPTIGDTTLTATERMNK